MADLDWKGICACKGCVLHEGHEGECKIAEMEEEDYEVEAILASGSVAARSSTR